MTERIGSKEQHSANDLKVTFQKGDGESVSIYFDAEKLKGARSEILKELGDYGKCALCCYFKQGFGACLARCLVDGQCCDGGTTNCSGT